MLAAASSSWRRSRPAASSSFPCRYGLIRSFPTSPTAHAGRRGGGRQPLLLGRGYGGGRPRRVPARDGTAGPPRAGARMSTPRAIASAPPAGRARGAVLPALARRARRLLDHEGAWSAAAQALASGMSFVVSILAARLLGVAEFGQFVLILAGVFIVGTLQYQVVSGPMMTVAGLRRRARTPITAPTRAG